MTTVTQWFDPKVDGQPVREGNYRRKYNVGYFEDYWDGINWRFSKIGIVIPHQDLPWRGLTSPDGE